MMWPLGGLDMLPNIPGTHTVRETSRCSRYGQWLQPFRLLILFLCALASTGIGDA
jgi:hypothetical protein